MYLTVNVLKVPTTAWDELTNNDIILIMFIITIHARVVAHSQILNTMVLFLDSATSEKMS